MACAGASEYDGRMAIPNASLEVLNQVLFGYSRERFAGITTVSRFAHYTPIAAALQIITGSPPGFRSLWMRNARYMNDTSEVAHGQHCIFAALENAELSRRFADS